MGLRDIPVIRVNRLPRGSLGRKESWKLWPGWLQAKPEPDIPTFALGCKDNFIKKLPDYTFQAVLRKPHSTEKTLKEKTTHLLKHLLLPSIEKDPWAN